MDCIVTWCQLTKDLRDRFVAELGDTPRSPWASDMVSRLTALVTRLDHLGVAFDELERHDRPACEAFLRALENS